MAEMTLREYLRFRASEMLLLEQDILRMNDKMADEVQQSTLKQDFQRHSGTTRQQIETLQRVVDRLGGPSEQREGMIERIGETLGISGGMQTPLAMAMLRDHQRFMEMHPPQALIDINDALEGDKVEHLEIASYRGLMALARQVGDNEIVSMLEENLRGEEAMRGRIEDVLPIYMREGGEGGRQAA